MSQCISLCTSLQRLVASPAYFCGYYFAPSFVNSVVVDFVKILEFFSIMIVDNSHFCSHKGISQRRRSGQLLPTVLLCFVAPSNHPFLLWQPTLLRLHLRLQPSQTT